jgi:hypothetical protein
MVFIGRFKGSNLIAEKLNVPETVAPKGQVSVTFDVSNGANTISMFEEDCCGPECGTNLIGSPLNGYAYRAIIEPEWTDNRTVEKCIGTTEIGTATDTIETRFEAPSDAGVYTLAVRVEGQNSGKGVETAVSVSVEEGAETSPEPEPDDRGGGGGADLGSLVISNPIKSAIAAAGIAAGLRYFGGDDGE